jgi:3-dehydroquinate dehydratase-2
MTRILLVQGANMSRIGRRNPAHYGSLFPAEFDAVVTDYAKGLGFVLEVFYTNIEGEAIDRIYEAADGGCEGLVMNPGGFTQNGYALRSCLKECGIPYIEVHCQNPVGSGIRSITGEASKGIVCGFGPDSYFIGLDAMKRLLAARASV